MDKRKLKREYKEARVPMGVYRVHNTADDRSLVGSSTNVAAMLNRHRAHPRNGVAIRPPGGRMPGLTGAKPREIVAMPRYIAPTHRGNGAMYRYIGVMSRDIVAMYRDIGAMYQ